MNILLISGSQRKDSFNTAVVNAIPALVPEHSFTVLDYTALALYSQDLEDPFPSEASLLKEQIQGADGIIIATPEHNRSMTAALKNLIDWTSRPYGQAAWIGKPVYVIGATPATTGTALAQADVRKSLLFLDARIMGQPELFINSAYEKITDGVLTDEDTKQHLVKGVNAFATFIEKS